MKNNKIFFYISSTLILAGILLWYISYNSEAKRLYDLAENQNSLNRPKTASIAHILVMQKRPISVHTELSKECIPRKKSCDGHTWGKCGLI